MDECATDNGGCGQICVNKPGSHECKCKEGNVLAEDGNTCNGEFLSFFIVFFESLISDEKGY